MRTARICAAKRSRVHRPKPIPAQQMCDPARAFTIGLHHHRHGAELFGSHLFVTALIFGWRMWHRPLIARMILLSGQRRSGDHGAPHPPERRQARRKGDDEVGRILPRVSDTSRPSR
jgi:hypothetical protein